MTVTYRKVLKSTLDELIRAYQKVNMHLDAALDVGVWNKRETKKEQHRLWNCFCDLAYELELQSGINASLYMELAMEIVKSEFKNDTLYTVLEQFGVEIAGEKWYFEGTILRRKSGGYWIVNGNQVYVLTPGETITVKCKYWAESAFGYNKRGEGELQGWEGHKLDGRPARVNFSDEVTE